MGSRLKACVCALALACVAASSTARAAGGREQESFADEALGRIQRHASDLRASLAVARRQRDPVQTQCVNEKLTALEIALRQARDERGTLRRASLREDQDAIAASSAVIARLDRRAREVRDEANQCVGHEAAFAEEVTVRAAPGRLEADYDSTGDGFTSAGAIAGGRYELDESISGAQITASPAPAAPAPAPPPSVPFTPGPPPPGSPYTVEATHEASLLAYSADVTLAVFQVDRSLDAVEAVAAATGGYLAQRGDAQVQIRVPRPRFLEALARVEKLGDVLHRNVAAEDVTDEYVDLELRLGNARNTRDRLAELLKAATVKDAVEIEKELAKVTEVIEQIEGRLKVLRDRVGYSTIAVSLQATAPSTVRTSAILPFAWLDTMGLGPLLSVPKGTR
jgi:hypothetical protein